MIKSHIFNLKYDILLNQEDLDRLVGELYSGNCSDAIIGTGKDGVISIEFERPAKSEALAIMSAQKDIAKVLSRYSFG